LSIVIAVAVVICLGPVVLAADQESPVATTQIEARINGQSWSGDLDGIARRRIIRILVVPTALGFYFNGREMQGAMYELGRELEKELNKTLKTGNLAINAVFIPVAREEMISKLAGGYGDVAGTLIAPRAAQGAPAVDYTIPLVPTAAGVVVTGPAAPPIAKLDDLSGHEIYVHQNTIIWDKLVELNQELSRAGKAPVKLVPADPNLLEDDIAQMVNAGLVPATVMYDQVGDAWAKVLPNLKVHHDVVLGRAPLCWAVQRNTPQLKAAVDGFIKTHSLGTAYGNTIARRYLKEIKWARDATSREDLKHFDEMVKLFRQYGNEYSFPYLLLAAQAYQESRLNQTLKSRVGAVGVMQIKPSTAVDKPILIPGVQKLDRNVEAGAKYMRYLVQQYYAKEPMDDVTKGLFAIASYNAGPAKIEKLRKEAAQRGYNPNLWFNNVEIIASIEIGRETVQYVSNIYKYYLAYKMVTERQVLSAELKQKSTARAAAVSGPN
jgi:membrane-bound lytic murein transglycosylase MltF